MLLYRKKAGYQVLIFIIIINAFGMTPTYGQDVNTAVISAPHVMEPSWVWDGPDGPWASFSIKEGSDDSGQDFRVFPAFSIPIILLPAQANFCNDSHQMEKTCIARGQFLPENSPSWQYQGAIDVLSALGLPRFVTGSETTEIQPYGLTNIRLGVTPQDSQNVTGQAVASIASKDLFMGFLGLLNTRFMLGEQGLTTFLAKLREADAIPSPSFSYTAGCYGWESVGKSMPPSLVLGGYDATRFDPSSILQADIRILTDKFDVYQIGVNITSITIVPDPVAVDDASQIPVYIEHGMTAYLDPLVPHMWLPQSACVAFEEAFGIVWDVASQMYLVNASTHANMLQMNATVIFSLSSSRMGETRNYTLPYAAFDLNVTYPLVETDSYYFPLKRASRLDTYVLGRAFLQFIHVSVDYEGGYFNISQARAGNDDEPQKIVSIQPPNSDPSGPNPSDNGNGPKSSTALKRLSVAAYAGIGVGAGVLILAVTCVFICRTKRWWPFKKREIDSHLHSHYEKPELHGDHVDRTAKLVEAMGKEAAELETVEMPQEVVGVNDCQRRTPGLDELHEKD